MERRTLDTSALIRHWHRCRTRPLSDYLPADTVVWAKQLIALHQTNAITTPVYVEFLAGVTSEHEFRLAKAYLEQFHCVDGGRIPPEDWKEAIRLAQRVPPSGKPRQLGDCLIRAIARRLRYRVRTYDQDFPA
jgi:predicted nucleic acid-binding protein